MPKISLTLAAAKAKDDEIFAKLNKVKMAAAGHKQNTMINQQKLEWTEQAKKLASEARHHEVDLEDTVASLGSLLGDNAEKDGEAGGSEDVWFQVNGVRQLLAQVARRDSERLQKSPDQALSLHDVVTSVAAALAAYGPSLATKAATLEQEIALLRGPLRRDLSADGLWVGDRQAEDRINLSDEEESVLDTEGPEAYEEELGSLNAQVSADLAALEREAVEAKRRCAGWDDDANFRFACIRREFQGQRRDLLLDRLSLEFPHLGREQLQAHEAHCDALRFVKDKQAAAVRQWRRDRLQLLRHHQGILEQRQRSESQLAARREDRARVDSKQRKLHARVDSNRARVSAKRSEQQRLDDEAEARRRSLEEEREAAQQRHAQAVRDQAHHFADRKRERRAQEEEATAEEERRAAAEHVRQQARHGERVRLRKRMDDVKRQEAARQRAAAEQERREREHRLQSAVERLAPTAANDPERLHRRPERMQAEAYLDPYECVPVAGRGLARCGFDEGRLMTDARYKISAALQAAGLYGTKAGHEVLARVAAPRVAPPSQMAAVFTGGYPG